MRHPSLPLLTIATLAGVAAFATPSTAQVVSRHSVIVTPHHLSRTVVVDTGRAGWWREHPGFVAYHGPRYGFAYAPGHGYYAVTHIPSGGIWAVGSSYPVSMRRYVVISPESHGLPVASPGHGWYYAGSGFVLVRHSNWVVTRAIAGGW